MPYVVLYHVIYHASNDVWQVSVCSQEILQMVGEVEEPSAPWRSGEHVGSREVKKLQQRARNTLDDWLDYYRVAVGTYLHPVLYNVCSRPPAGIKTATSGCDVLNIMSYQSMQQCR